MPTLGLVWPYRSQTRRTYLGGHREMAIVEYRHRPEPMSDGELRRVAHRPEPMPNTPNRGMVICRACGRELIEKAGK